MGNLNVIKLSSKEDRANYIHQLTKDIKALEYMLENDMIEKTPIRIGAEQEFRIVDEEFNPNNNSLELLELINDEHFTTEIGNYNLEINLDPIQLKGNCFSQLHKQLETLLNKAKDIAQSKNSKILLTGILPTLGLKHISVENMTKIQRYSVLDEAIKESRKQDFHIHIKGTDELNLLHDSVMLEGCNTSFQMHLQINPDNFIGSYNWAQAISGPVLSVCSNSPILFGKELWDETRIALFTQSVDTRANSFLLNEKQSRVSFGSKWETGKIQDIFKDNIARFRSLITSEYVKDSMVMLNNNETPKLKALNLHNGTVYFWNRMCYGVSNNKPHLRIENRYIPSGPSITDEIANMVFWVGVMLGQPKELKNIHQKMDFRDAKSNFFSAARYGMATQFKWEGKIVSSQELILNKFLPMAYKGLYSMGVSPKDAEHYLKVIENRVASHNGSQWITKSYRNLQKDYKKYEALQLLTSNMYEKQIHDYPVSTWNVLTNKNVKSLQFSKRVKHLMSTDIFSVGKTDSLELVVNIMKWKKIHHLPVIDEERQLVGIINWSDALNHILDEDISNKSVEEIMDNQFLTINAEEPIEKAKKDMKSNSVDCLLVVKEKKLIGILTSNDII